MHTRRATALLVLATLAAVGLLGQVQTATPPPPLSGAARRPRPGAPASAALLFGGQLDVNAASVEELAALPGIGPRRARRIATHRARHGWFRGLDDLAAVPGIGPVTARRLEGVVTYGR